MAAFDPKQTLANCQMPRLMRCFRGERNVPKDNDRPLQEHRRLGSRMRREIGAQLGN